MVSPLAVLGDGSLPKWRHGHHHLPKHAGSHHGFDRILSSERTSE